MDLRRSQPEAIAGYTQNVGHAPPARMDPSSKPAAGVERKPSGYGLPCAKCHLYYPADLDVCPTCRSRERVSALAYGEPIRSAQPADPLPDTDLLEKEREEFLQQFKSQFLAVQAEMG